MSTALQRLALPVLVGLMGCRTSPAPSVGAEPAGAPPTEQVTTPEPPRGAWFPFAIRGRWADPRAITYAIDATGGTLSGRQTERGIAAAIEVWAATGLVALRPSRQGEEPDVTFSWQRKSHGDARPFGIDRSVAHTGPVSTGTFVHFDAGHKWVERHVGDDLLESESLLGAAVHEIGHVVGLGHSPDSRAVLYMDSRAEELHASDLAGLHSLYGGGTDGPGDLAIFDDDGTRRAVLRRVAHAERTDWVLFDTDGDGTLEVVVWRTDAAGHGALIAYHYSAGESGPELIRTSGPFISPLLSASAEVDFRIEGEERLVVLALPDGTVVACAFGETGRPGPPRAHTGSVDASPRATELHGDLDGDGRPETVRDLGRAHGR